MDSHCDKRKVVLSYPIVEGTADCLAMRNLEAERKDLGKNGHCIGEVIKWQYM